MNFPGRIPQVVILPPSIRGKNPEHFFTIPDPRFHGDKLNKSLLYTPNRLAVILNLRYFAEINHKKINLCHIYWIYRHTYHSRFFAL